MSFQHSSSFLLMMHTKILDETNKNYLSFIFCAVICCSILHICSEEESDLLKKSINEKIPHKWCHVPLTFTSVCCWDANLETFFPHSHFCDFFHTHELHEITSFNPMTNPYLLLIQIPLKMHCPQWITKLKPSPSHWYAGFLFIYRILIR